MKLAVIFPGIGYHTDKPLLYYGKKVAKVAGYEIIEVSYCDLPHGIKGDAELMFKAYEIAYKQVVEQLKDVNFSEYEDVVFISKSIGTAVAATVARVLGVQARHIYLTPVLQSMNVIRSGSGIVFHGLNDSWCGNSALKERCLSKELGYYEYEDANHSLETGDTARDFEYLIDVVGKMEGFLK